MFLSKTKLTSFQEQDGQEGSEGGVYGLLGDGPRPPPPRTEIIAPSTGLVFNNNSNNLFHHVPFTVNAGIMIYIIKNNSQKVIISLLDLLIHFQSIFHSTIECQFL